MAAVAALVTGVRLGFGDEGAWLSRMGSVITVIGVLLAGSRKFDALRIKAVAVISEHEEKEFSSVIERIRAERPKLSEGQLAELKDKVYALTREAIEGEIQSLQRVFKIHELILVVVGTVLNGFGEWIIKILSCG